MRIGSSWSSSKTPPSSRCFGDKNPKPTTTKLLMQQEAEAQGRSTLIGITDEYIHVDCWSYYSY